MKLNRTDLKKIIYDFNSISNRLLQANFQDYVDVVCKYVAHIKSTPLIYDYVCDCGPCEQSLDNEFKEVGESYGHCIFSLGDTAEEEVRNVFAILDYIAKNKVEIHYGVAMGYSSSNKYQDCIKGFNDRVVMVFIRHIESYLTKIGIDMGIDDKTVYSISVNNGQVNIAHDNATLSASNNIVYDFGKLDSIIAKVRAEASGIEGEEAEIMNDSLDAIQEELKSGKPKRGILKAAVNGLKALKGTAEFAAAIATLIQFLQTVS